MPFVDLGNLAESLYMYWMKLTVLVRDMITFEPDNRFPLVINGQKVSRDQEFESKFIRNTDGIKMIIFSYKLFSVCEDHVREFKCCFRLTFSMVPDCRWNDYVAKCILILWEVVQLVTYNQSYTSDIPLLKLTSFRISRKFYKKCICRKCI